MGEEREEMVVVRQTSGKVINYENKNFIFLPFNPCLHR
jgi:hypothetical protein